MPDVPLLRSVEVGGQRAFFVETSGDPVVAEPREQRADGRPIDRTLHWKPIYHLDGSEPQVRFPGEKPGEWETISVDEARKRNFKGLDAWFPPENLIVGGTNFSRDAGNLEVQITSPVSTHLLDGGLRYLAENRSRHWKPVFSALGGEPVIKFPGEKPGEWETLTLDQARERKIPGVEEAYPPQSFFGTSNISADHLDAARASSRLMHWKTVLTDGEPLIRIPGEKTGEWETLTLEQARERHVPGIEDCYPREPRFSSLNITASGEPVYASLDRKTIDQLLAGMRASRQAAQDLAFSRWEEIIFARG